MTTAWDFGVSRELDLVERTIRESIESEEPLLTEISQYVIASGGKRIRPTVTLLAFKAVGGKEVEKLLSLPAVSSEQTKQRASRDLRVRNETTRRDQGEAEAARIRAHDDE